MQQTEKQRPTLGSIRSTYRSWICLTKRAYWMVPSAARPEPTHASLADPCGRLGNPGWTSMFSPPPRPPRQVQSASHKVSSGVIGISSANSAWSQLWESLVPFPHRCPCATKGNISFKIFKITLMSHKLLFTRNYELQMLGSHLANSKGNLPQNPGHPGPGVVTYVTIHDFFAESKNPSIPSWWKKSNLNSVFFPTWTVSSHPTGFPANVNIGWPAKLQKNNETTGECEGHDQSADLPADLIPP